MIAGIGLGVYFGQWKGFGWGGGSSSGFGSSGNETLTSIGAGDEVDDAGEPEKNDTPIAIPQVVRVVIDEEHFLLRQVHDGTRDTPITMEKLIRLIEQAPGDADGLRVRIYEKFTARPKAEESLKKALEVAGIKDSAVLWVPTPIK